MKKIKSVVFYYRAPVGVNLGPPGMVCYDMNEDHPDSGLARTDLGSVLAVVVVCTG